jgi:hypothetical protein
MKCECSNERNSLFKDCNYLFNFKDFVELCHGGYDGDCVLREKDGEETESFLRIESDGFREFLRLSGGSRCEDGYTFVPSVSQTSFEVAPHVHEILEKELNGLEHLQRVFFRSVGYLLVISGIQKCSSLCRFEFPSSLEIIERTGLNECTSLNEIIFTSDSHLKEISGIQNCTSLCRIEFPSSLEFIGQFGLNECTSLNEIIFSSDSHVKRIDGIQKCPSLCRIELPSSTEVVRGFSECPRLRVMIIGAECCVKNNRGIRNRRPFLVHEDQNMKDSRHMIHLGSFVSKP